MLGLGPVGTDFDPHWDAGDLDLRPRAGQGTAVHGDAPQTEAAGLAQKALFDLATVLERCTGPR